MAKKFHIWVLFIMLCASSMAQVGINTTDPKAQLDIAISDADDPEITDGILIPRINDFPEPNPTEAQHGMLVFLNEEQDNFPVGFYFWNNNESSWKAVSGAIISGFYTEGTTSSPNNIDDAIYRNGNIRIGGVENEEIKLAVTIEASEENIKTGLEILNDNSADSRNTYSITATNSSLTDAVKYGIKNTVSADGDGVHYGIWNNVSQRNNTEVYGIYNDVGETFGADEKHYGIYSEIGTAGGNGTVYGIYSKAQGTDEVYAGFFEGRVGIGTPAENYVLPSTTGSSGQILILGENDNMNWRYPNQKIYTSTESETGNYVIQPETYTLRINDKVSSITIPNADLYRGRIIILVSWSGNSYKDFNFTSGDDIYDVTTNSEIPGIDGGQVLKIQSAGNGWTLIGRMLPPPEKL